jgi:hypothetical protein
LIEGDRFLLNQPHSVALHIPYLYGMIGGDIIRIPPYQLSSLPSHGIAYQGDSEGQGNQGDAC